MANQKPLFKAEGHCLSIGPIPDADLADLVPEEMPEEMLWMVAESVRWRSEKKDGLECYHGENLKRAYGPIRAAILRNIEEAK